MKKQTNTASVPTALDEKFIIVGKVGTPHGVKGWLKIYSYAHPPENILNYVPWYLASASQSPLIPQDKLLIENSKLQAKCILVKFAGIESPEVARSYTGNLVIVPRQQLPTLTENQDYWCDLIGMTVLNTRGEEYGKVIYLMETGANDVLVVKGTKEYAIPYLRDQVIVKVDLEKQQIIVDWELI